MSVAVYKKAYNDALKGKKYMGHRNMRQYDRSTDQASYSNGFCAGQAKRCQQTEKSQYWKYCENKAWV